MLSVACVVALASTSALAASDPIDKILERFESCIAKIDKQVVDDYQKLNNESSSKVMRLCETGKRDEAQRAHEEFMNTLESTPAYGKILSCLAHLGDEDDDYEDGYEDDYDDDNDHVCD